MLNTTIYKNETVVTPITQVVEKTITPDKVSEMYDSVREQVEKDILRKIVIDDNELKAVVVEMITDYATNQRKLFWRFTLNGKEYTDYFDLTYQMHFSESEIAGKVFDSYKTVLARELFNHSIKEFTNTALEKRN